MAGGLESAYQSPLQDTALECSVCAELFTKNHDHFPRVLKCGHTFCTKCLTRIMTPRGIKCPMCNKEHRFHSLDISEIAPNYAVLSIISADKEFQSVESTEPSPVLCEYCNNQPATIICHDCNVGAQVKFCRKCDAMEHNRPFPPVQRHKRVALDPKDGGAQTPRVIWCSVHYLNEATLFSQSLNRFACPECKLASEWLSQEQYFDDINTVKRDLRAEAQKLNQYSRDAIEKLNQSQQILSTTVVELGPSLTNAKTLIQSTFADIVNVLQERQQELLSSVEEEYTERKGNLERQLERVHEAKREFVLSHEALNALIQKSTLDFLLRYNEVIGQLNHLHAEEDRSLQRPVTQNDIPVHISPDVIAQLRVLGAVGGGAAPIEIACVPTCKRSNLMQLEWQLAEGKRGRVLGYEVEFEYLPSTDAGGVATQNCYVDTEPHIMSVPGNDLSAYIDGLCPGYKYRFRIRAQSVAGWGMWSAPVVGTCSEFPITAGYTQRIHSIRIPKEGLYRITAAGAKAHDGLRYNGGRGAIMSATFSLKAGDSLLLLSGGMSQLSICNSGGGGGSFVVLNEVSQENLLIAAGGGGGTRGFDSKDIDGCDASLEPCGTDGRGHEHGNGGRDGAPGEDANKFPGPCWGYGGAGFLQDSSTAKCFPSGGMGGQSGGFGGGGGVGLLGGGGGGGYSGGGGGRGGGGGGSYVRADGKDVEKRVGNEEPGCITVERLDQSAAPSLPSSAAYTNYSPPTTTNFPITNAEDSLSAAANAPPPRGTGSSTNSIPPHPGVVDSQTSYGSSSSGSSLRHGSTSSSVGSFNPDRNSVGSFAYVSPSVVGSAAAAAGTVVDPQLPPVQEVTRSSSSQSNQSNPESAISISPLSGGMSGELPLLPATQEVSVVHPLLEGVPVLPPTLSASDLQPMLPAPPAALLDSQLVPIPPAPQLQQQHQQPPDSAYFQLAGLAPNGQGVPRGPTNGPSAPFPPPTGQDSSYN